MDEREICEGVRIGNAYMSDSRRATLRHEHAVADRQRQIGEEFLVEAIECLVRWAQS